MKVPIVISSPPPEFGELKEDPRFLAEEAANKDLSYVPGFSEMRRKRDTEINELVRGRRRANEVSSLPINLRWVRCQNKAGEPDSRKQVSAARSGYRAVTREDVGQAWLKEVPAGASITADGMLRQGDTVLMVTDQASAARNEAKKRIKTESMMRGTQESFRDTVKAEGGQAWVEQSTPKKAGS